MTPERDGADETSEPAQTAPTATVLALLLVCVTFAPLASMCVASSSREALAALLAGVVLVHVGVAIPVLLNLLTPTLVSRVKPPSGAAVVCLLATPLARWASFHLNDPESKLSYLLVFTCLCATSFGSATVAAVGGAKDESWRGLVPLVYGVVAAVAAAGGWCCGFFTAPVTLDTGDGCDSSNEQ